MSYQQFFKKAQDVKRGTDMKFKVKSKPAEQSELELRRAVRMKTRRKNPVPWRAVIALALSLGASGFYLAAPEYFEQLIDRIEVRAMGSASASEAGKAAEKSASGATKTEKAAGAEVHGEKGKGPDEKHAGTQDLSHFEKLKQRKEELDMREKELSELEEELQRQKVELDKRIVQLEEMRSQIAQVLKDRVEVDQEKVTKLVDLYSNMKPKQAADVIGTINEDLAVEVLAKMKKKNAAEIMNLLSPEKARVLSEKYTGYRRNHPDPKG
ncbi:MAG: hypothetical protein KF799_15740 [Bdellovibrionales bacterium]|nr:hypothetical protein [Bdellovibrionales bacterium]